MTANAKYQKERAKEQAYNVHKKVFKASKWNSIIGSNFNTRACFIQHKRLQLI